MVNILFYVLIIALKGLYGGQRALSVKIRRVEKTPSNFKWKTLYNFMSTLTSVVLFIV